MKKTLLLLTLVFLVGCVETTSEFNYNVDAKVSPYPISVGEFTTISFRVLDEFENSVDLDEAKIHVKIHKPGSEFNFEEDGSSEVRLSFPEPGDYAVFVSFEVEEIERPVVGDLVLSVN